MRLMTWNVNGIRTLPHFHPWNQYKPHEKIIDALGADIICIQETKVTRKLLEKDWAVMEEFDGFFSFLRPPAGRHGTAIFTRRSAVVPVKAEEGLSNVLIPSSTTSDQRIGGYPTISDLEDVEYDDLNKLESEGRTTVIDCGMFVLINLYSPNLTNDERLKFKNDFNVLVDTRVRNLIRLGREVIVVGDLNICAQVIDTCEPQNLSQDGDVGKFHEPVYRRWLQDFIGDRGPMIDIVRQFHPDRQGMYTCWDTKTEARKTNFGGRLDYILITPGLRPWIKNADIQAEVKGSDHCPVFVDFYDEIEIEGRGKVSLWLEMNPNNQESDPSAATRPDPPPFATRFYPEFSSQQKSIKSFFSKGGPAPTTPSASSSSMNPPQAVASTSGSQRSTASVSPAPSFARSNPSSNQNQIVSSSSSLTPSTSLKSLGKRKASPVLAPRMPSPPPAGGQQKLSGFFKPPTVPQKRKLTKAKTTKIAKIGTKSTSRSKSESPPTPSIASTSTPPALSEMIDITSSDDEATASGPSPKSKSRKKHEAEIPTSSAACRDDSILKSFRGIPGDVPRGDDEEYAERQAQDDDEDRFDPMDLEAAYESTSQSSSNGNGNPSSWALNASSSSSQWNSIFAPKVAPLCETHQEPARLWTVNKSGINKDPVGPGYDNGQRPKSSVNNEYRCDFFKWDTQVKRPAGIPLDRQAKKVKQQTPKD